VYYYISDYTNRLFRIPSTFRQYIFRRQQRFTEQIRFLRHLHVAQPAPKLELKMTVKNFQESNECTRYSRCDASLL